MYGRQQQVRFGPPETPNVIKILLIANVGVFILQNIAPQVAVTTSAGVIPTDWVTAWFAAWPERIWSTGAFWQPATYMWLHSPNSLGHIAFNMFALWMFGSPLASAWGDRRFLQFYLLTGLGAGLVIATWPLLVTLFGGVAAAYYIPTLGASGAVYGVLLAYGLTWPDRTLYLLFPPIPLKAIYLIPFIFFFSYLFGPSNISHAGHLGGVAAGWLLYRRWTKQPLLPSVGTLKLRYRRWKMRRQLHEVRREQEKYWRDDDRRMH